MTAVTLSPSFTVHGLQRLHGRLRLSLLFRLLLIGIAAVLAACGGGSGEDGDAPLRLPSVVTQPADQTVVEGDAARFEVTAEGSAPLAYQWSRRAAGGDFTPIGGATAASLVVGSATLGDSGSEFRVEVSHGMNSVVSSAAALVVTPRTVAPAITVHPADQAVTAPAAATFHVTATGTALSYLWQASDDGGATYAAVAGAADAPSLTILDTEPAQDGRRYRVQVSNAAGSVQSREARLTVQPTPATPGFTSQPQAQTVVAGGAVGFNAVAIGTPTPALRWRLEGTPLADGLQASGACAGASAAGTATSHLTLSDVPLACSGVQLRASASNGVGSAVLSSAVGLTVTPAPAAPRIAQEPADATVAVPATATFSALADGVPTPTVQWQQSVDGGAHWANIAGAVASGYTTPATVAADTGKQLRAVFRNTAGEATTQAATLTATVPPATVSLFLGDIGGRGNFDGQGSAARFNTPSGLAMDAAGNVFVADVSNNRIRKVTPGGMVTTIAGSGARAFSDGSGPSAAFAGPSRIAVAPDGTLFVADTGNNVIRRITPAGQVSTLAGRPGPGGFADGAGSAARFNQPHGLALDESGTLYVADSGNRSIRKVSTEGLVTTLAGDPYFGGGPFQYPTALAVEASGTVYVADSGASFLTTVSPSGQTARLPATVATGRGDTAPATFSNPRGLAIDATGAIYVSEYNAHTVRRIGVDGVTTVVAGLDQQRGNANGLRGAARFNSPQGIAIDASGALIVADTGNDTLRTITPKGVVKTLAGLAENTGAVDGPKAHARFDPIGSFAIDKAGNLFVPDPSLSTLRKVSPAGDVTTFAGVANHPDGVDGTGSAARFDEYGPNRIAIDASGTMYVDGLISIRKVTPEAVVTAFAGSPTDFGGADGTGPQARFSYIGGLATDALGNVYVGDNGAVRKITPAGQVTTLAGVVDDLGFADGAGSAARFDFIGGLVVLPSGTVYVIDDANHAIRKITAAGVVTTLAGSPSRAASVDGAGALAGFASLVAITSDGEGNLYVSDDCAIRRVTLSGTVTTVLGVPGECGLRLGTDARFYAPFALAVIAPKRLLLGSHNALLIADLP